MDKVINYEGHLTWFERWPFALDGRSEVKKMTGQKPVEKWTAGQISAALWQNEIEVNGRTVTTRNIVIATGAVPFVPPIKGLEDISYLTSDSIWDIRKLPEKLVVLGVAPSAVNCPRCLHDSDPE